MSVHVKFCGAAGTVTGSCFLIKYDDKQFLVDCGLFQGSKTIKELNYQPFPFDPKKIEFALLTHAHTDHTALIPKLTKARFKGPIYTTPATKDLLRYMLPDSGYIQEMEVKRLNERNKRSGRPTVSPIYTRDDAEQAISQINPIDYEHWYTPDECVRFRFWNAGHILGSASIEVEILDEGKWIRLLFSGDLGHEHKVFHDDPDAPTDFDYVFCEATYGGRARENVSVERRRGILAKEIKKAMGKGGNLIIPSFAVERSQELLLDIAYLLRGGAIPCIAVFLDSPLAIKITSVFASYAAQLKNTGDGVLPFSHPSFHFTETVDESKSINTFRGGAIILAASGMCDAGRIRHHLKNHLWDSNSTVLLVGYQAVGTLGNLLENGAKKVKIQGEEINVRAQIRTIDVYSGHADNYGLIEWINNRKPINHNIFLIHGSKESLSNLKENLLNNKFKHDKIIIPDMDDEYKLAIDGKTVKVKNVTQRLPKDVIDKPDWHNKLAQLTIDIRENLDHAENDTSRNNIIQKLRSALSKKNQK